MTLRALDALRDADVVCAEDTRVTGKLLAALGVEGKRLERLDENVMGQRLDSLVERVQAGEIIAYCSDAGMPGVSDPGLRLVAAMRDAGPTVEVLPGPSAAVTAYVASGTTSASFFFGGFFPRKSKARLDALNALGGLEAALVFYESPNRLASALRDVAEVFPQRTVAVCRELTKLHEEVARGKAREIADEFASRESVKGEIAIVIDAPSKAEEDEVADPAAMRALASELVARGERSKAIAKQLAQQFGIPRSEAYDIALAAQAERQNADA